MLTVRSYVTHLTSLFYFSASKTNGLIKFDKDDTVGSFRTKMSRYNAKTEVYTYSFSVDSTSSKFDLRKKKKKK